MADKVEIVWNHGPVRIAPAQLTSRLLTPRLLTPRLLTSRRHIDLLRVAGACC